MGTTADYDGVKKAILDHYNINPERCRKKLCTHSWTRDAEPKKWVARGLKLMRRWLHPDEGLDQVLEKIAVEQFLNALPQELRIWVASQNPTTPTKVAELIELYNSAHNSNTQGNRKQPLDPKSTPKTSTKELAGKPRGERWARNNYSTVREKKPLAEVVCFKCGKKGHLARNCTEKTFHAQGVTEKVGLFGEGEVNGRHVRRIQIDIGASRTVVKRSLISPSDIREESIVVTFGNGTSGEYPLAPVRVKIDDEEYIA